MSIFSYIIIFIIGTLLGSFCTLAVYRIPLKQDITHERSYCPRCNHRLNFLDLIPVLSYIFLRGKCKYCKEKIRPRYFIIEILSGIFLVLFAVSINFMNLNMDKLLYFALGTIYFVTLILIAGIDKEHKKIEKAIILFGAIIFMFYIVYLYILKGINVYRYGICLFLMLFFAIIGKLIKKNNYTIDNLILYTYMSLFSSAVCMVLTASATLFAIAVNIIINKINKKEELMIPIAFYMCIFNVFILLLQNFRVI